MEDSIFVGFERHVASLNELDKSYGPASHYSNRYARFQGDYLKSMLSGADISVGNLHWEFKEPLSYLAGIQNMLGSAKLIIFFVPIGLMTAVRTLIKSSFKRQPDVVEYQIPFQTGRRVHENNHAYEGSFFCLAGGLLDRYYVSR